MTGPDHVREATPEYIRPSPLLTYDDYCHIPPGHQRYELIGGDQGGTITERVS